jgi:Putative lumazine-binding
MKTFFCALFLFVNSFGIFAQTDNSDLQAIQETLRYYLDGGTNSDSLMFSKAFLPEGQMIYINNGKTTIVPLKDFMARIKPGGPKQERSTRIVSIHIEGNAANAHLEIDAPKAVFQDFMNLLKTENGWKIVNKVFYRTDKPAVK